ncbi:hypothetical protein CEXT_394711 [Caerostris extrusa]|uniref:Uncharacterized protein n=1 Tax=Caerostris extrusa TaxID=172846 RepID=A0AAV4Y4F4_CAEEX|nr:hypothetical protein CEXT_394711 [Caerostris extrusa]
MPARIRNRGVCLSLHFSKESQSFFVRIGSFHLLPIQCWIPGGFFYFLFVLINLAHLLPSGFCYGKRVRGMGILFIRIYLSQNGLAVLKACRDKLIRGFWLE